MAGQTLPNAHQLDAVIMVNTELAGAVFAGYFADACGHPKPGESGDDDLADLLEAIMDGRTWVGGGDGKSKRNRVLREHRSAPSGETLDGGEAHVAGCGDGLRILRRYRVATSESDLTAGDEQTYRRRDLTGRDPLQDELAEGRIQSRLLGPGPTQELQLHVGKRSPEMQWLTSCHSYPAPKLTISQVSLNRLVTLVALCALLASACGEEGLLDGLGDQSADVIHGDTSLTTTTVEPENVDTPIGSVRASDVVWFNDGIAGEGSGTILEVISAVWRRGDGITSVIQASRNEISGALPGIQFPELLPSDVGWITSQLVYDVASGTLGQDTSAQFGLWHEEPYTVEGGRTAVIWVRPATSADVIGSIVAESTPSSLLLSWVAESFHYQISCPIELLEDLCWQMAESPMPLSLLLPAA